MREGRTDMGYISGEHVRVFEWRRQRLRALGYPSNAATRLALSDVDVHELERLIRRGCSPELAARIAA